MSDTKEKEDQERGDEVLKRMLKTPPKPHDASKEMPSKEDKRNAD